jgi:hypothetical protein
MQLPLGKAVDGDAVQRGDDRVGHPCALAA